MKKAFIFAAGLGTRLAPLTNSKPKALVELCGKPLLWHVAKKIISEGFDSITINVYHFSNQIIDYVKSNEFVNLLGGNKVEINVSDETECLLDTGGGLRFAATTLFEKSQSPVLLHNVDIYSNARLKELYDQIGDNDALLLVSQRKTSRYLLFDTNKRLVGWTNIATKEVRTPFRNLDVSACTKLAFSGVHVVSKNLVDSMCDWPSKFGIMDFYIDRCKDLHIYGTEQSHLQLTDIGKLDTLQNLQNKL